VRGCSFAQSTTGLPPGKRKPPFGGRGQEAFGLRSGGFRYLLNGAVNEPRWTYGMADTQKPTFLRSPRSAHGSATEECAAGLGLWRDEIDGEAKAQAQVALAL